MATSCCSYTVSCAVCHKIIGKLWDLDLHDVVVTDAVLAVKTQRERGVLAMQVEDYQPTHQKQTSHRTSWCRVSPSDLKTGLRLCRQQYRMSSDQRMLLIFHLQTTSGIFSTETAASAVRPYSSITNVKPSQDCFSVNGGVTGVLSVSCPRANQSWFTCRRFGQTEQPAKSK